MKKYTTLFKQFDKLDTFTNIVCNNVKEITRKSYPTPDSLLNFNESRYRGLYKNWGENGIFNHKKSEITPLLYGLHRPKRKMRQTHLKIRWLEALPSVKSTDGLTFSISSFLFEMVKDEIQNSFGLCCLYIQHFPKFIMFIAELASRVLNTIFLFSQLTQLEHTKRRNSSLFSLFL